MREQEMLHPNTSTMQRKKKKQFYSIRSFEKGEGKKKIKNKIKERLEFEAA